MSARKDIVDRLVSRLEGITKANGYATDVREVTARDLGYSDCKAFPTIAVVPGEVETEELLGGARLARLKVTLRGIISDKSSPAATLDSFYGDILQALEAAAYTDRDKILSIGPMRVMDDWHYSDTDGFGALEMDIVYIFAA